MKILFQGDSITDAGRDRENHHDLGKGYPLYAAKYIKEEHPETDFEFINLDCDIAKENLVKFTDEEFVCKWIYDRCGSRKCRVANGSNKTVSLLCCRNFNSYGS